jgi:ankyrin repeat protein
MRLIGKRNEMILLAIISLMSFAANLPSGTLSHFVDQRMLLITLGTSVLIALFQYVQMLLSSVMLISSVGANLPPEVAQNIGVQPPILTVTLILIVSIALINRFYKLLPTGLSHRTGERIDTEESRTALLAAIAKGNQITLLQLLETNVEVNFFHQGWAPILLAAEKGYSDITQILIDNGANFRVRNEAGLMPIDIAIAKRFIRSAEVLYLADKEHPEGVDRSGLNLVPA